jgi:hypothetical protein
MTNKLSVSWERHEIKFLSRPRIAGKAFCADCQAEVRWLVPEEAMVLAEISLRKVFRLIENGNFHFLESAEGFLLVCAESLAKRMRKD